MSYPLQIPPDIAFMLARNTAAAIQRATVDTILRLEELIQLYPVAEEAQVEIRKVILALDHIERKFGK